MNGKSATFSNTHKGINSLYKYTGVRIRGIKKTILAGSEVKRQVLLPAAAIQAWRRKEAGRFKEGWGGVVRDLG